MNTQISPLNGLRTPVKNNYEPLMLMGKPIINGNHRQIMNNEWIYINDRNGSYSINVVRADYCIMNELKGVTIKESIGNKKITKRLQRFIDEVSENIVFTKSGKTYRVCLKQITRQTFDLKKVVPYWTTTSIGCNRNMTKKYHNYQIAIDIDETFYVKGIM